MRSFSPKPALLLAILCTVAATPARAQTSPEPSHHISIEGNQFILDDKPFQIISGEMHYARIPREYWRDRMQKARAMGLNTITTYVFWNLHEPRPGVYDFTGSLDVAAFIRTAQEEGLYVILRPGPYVCAEWDLGGLPAWLLADPNIILRSSDEKFLGPVERWFERLGRELAPLQLTRGGPILAVQVENEYGSFGNDHAYMTRILKAIKAAGMGEVLLYTADGGDQLASGTLPDIHAVVNFGPGEAKTEFAKLQKFRPGQPVMSGEYWDGWFDHWGDHHHVTNADQQTQELDWILSQGYSISLYMFHGGTNFGFMNGANWEKIYEPDVTSYDYDSPVSESGALTEKYFAFRNVIQKRHPEVKLPDPPAAQPTIEIPDFELTESTPLWLNLPRATGLDQSRATAVDNPRSMEFFGQSYGYILYRTTLLAATKGDLVIPELRSYAEVMINGQPIGTIDRRKRPAGQKEDRFRIDAVSGAMLEILVEGSGRINFTSELRNERQGIQGPVTVGGRRLTPWQVYPLPMQSDDLARLNFANAPAAASSGPQFYRGHFNLTATGDTFLDTRGWGKGNVWINGHALGRFWNLGPQQTLYVPGIWLKTGVNEVVVFVQSQAKNRRLRGLRSPILDEINAE